MSLLDEEESSNTVEIEEGKAPTVSLTSGTGKKRGRPPGSKNKPREETLTPNLEGAIRGIFVVCSLIAKFFGYAQTDDLTDSEVKEGARAFTPLANKIPWFATVAMYIGPPVWLYMTFTKKFAKRETNATPDSNPNVTGNGSSDSDSESARATG